MEVAVVLSFPEYLELQKKQVPLSQFFRQSPLGEIDLERDRSPVQALDCSDEKFTSSAGREALVVRPPIKSNGGIEKCRNQSV